MIDSSIGAQAAASLLISLLATLALTPAAIRLAGRFDLEDDPGGWKTHPRPTPYLGGAVILAAAGVAAWVADVDIPVPILLVTLGLMVVGLIDDVAQLHAWPRLIAELGAATVVVSAGLGWDTGSAPFDAALTIVWILAVVNAVNLIDLMDGVAGSTLCATALGVAGLAAIRDETGLAIGALAVAGACFGFLRFNLADPARIFLGDGGSMPLGFLAAVGVIAAVQGEPAGEAAPAACLLVGVPLFDAVYRTQLRIRNGVSLMTAGPDSLANLLLGRLGSPRRVSMVAAALQLAGGASAIAAIEVGQPQAVALGALALGTASVAAASVASAARAGPEAVAPAQPALKAK